MEVRCAKGIKAFCMLRVQHDHGPFPKHVNWFVSWKTPLEDARVVSVLHPAAGSRPCRLLMLVSHPTLLFWMDLAAALYPDSGKDLAFWTVQLASLHMRYCRLRMTDATYEPSMLTEHNMMAHPPF